MPTKDIVLEKDLGALAKRFREQSGKTRAEAARELRVSQTSIYQAEEKPSVGLVKLRMRLIETYSSYRVRGPLFRVERKRKA